jgi:hypothetical protein
MVGLVAVAALVVGVLVAGWVRPGGSEEAKPAAPQEAPSVSPPPVGPRRAAPRPEVDVSGSSGLNIRYLDKNGRTRKLDVKDFPR